MTRPPPNATSASKTGPDEEPFGSSGMRLNARQLLVVLALAGSAVLLTPRLWTRFERFDTGPDYRLPYALSKDYWLYGRRLGQAAGSNRVTVLGDSVVWGEYVLPDGTLSHFLNREAGKPDRFINGGVNGVFPLALEGLVMDYGRALRGQRVVAHCNMLWMTSPKADLSTTKEESFNHSRLVPQFRPRIPCYRADAHERIGAVLERQVEGLAWVSHLQNTYFEQMSIPQWTLADDGREPPHFPNLYRNPLAAITLNVPAAPASDSDRGPGSPRHKPWSVGGQGTTHFEWVESDSSLQWRAFQRTIRLLKARGNDVMVVVGPFNEHIMAEENRPAYRRILGQITNWLTQNRVPWVAPDVLPSRLYADASHPLSEGYELLAKRIHGNEVFQRWINGGQTPATQPRP